MAEIILMNEKKYLDKNILIENKSSTKLSITKSFSRKSKGLLDYISFVKIISAFAVIILHTNMDSFENFKNGKKWIYFNFIEQFFIFGVPFFVLCIGATLLDFNEKYGLIEYFKRRLLKVVVPLIGWNIISYYYKVYFVKSMKKEKFDIVNILKIFYENKLYGLFYSFHIFITTYMIIPLLAYVEKNKKLEIYSYCFVTLLISQSLIPYIIDISPNKFNWPYNIDAGYIIYIFSGYLIQNYEFSKSIKIFIYMIGIFCFLVQFIGTYVLTFRHKKTSWKHIGYLKFPTVVYCNSLFLFIKENCFLIFKIINKNIINKLGSLTIGPFFLHWPVIDFFNKYPYLIFNINIFSFCGGTLICVLCFTLTYILKKIPIIKYLVP